MICARSVPKHYIIGSEKSKEEKEKRTMTEERRICNVCGKKFQEWDKENDIGIHKQICYGSAFDGAVLDLDLCCECFDKLVRKFIPMCKINPIVELRERKKERR